MFLTVILQGIDFSSFISQYIMDLLGLLIYNHPPPTPPPSSFSSKIDTGFKFQGSLFSFGLRLRNFSVISDHSQLLYNQHSFCKE